MSWAKVFWFCWFLIGHIIDMSTQFNRRELVVFWLVFYFAFPFIAWFFTYRTEGVTGAGVSDSRWDLLGMLLMFGALAWGLPWMRAILFRLLASTFTLYFDSVIVFFPILPLLFVMNPEIGTPNIQKYGSIYLIAWAFLFTLNFLLSVEGMDIAGISPQGINLAMPQLMNIWRPFSFVGQGIANMASNSVEKFNSFTTQISEGWQRQIDYAIDPTAQTVEESKAKQIGIFVSPLRKAGGILYQGDEVSVFTDIEARLLDEQDDIDVHVECIANLKSPIATSLDEIGMADKTDIVGEVIPAERFSLASLDRQSIDCRWPYLRIPGTYQAEARIDFDFNTLAYMPIYFTSRTNLQNFLRDEALGQDVPVELDTLPTTHTSGPLAITLSMGQGTIGVAPDIEEHALTVSVNNKWSGHVKMLKQFVFMIPKGFSLDKVSGVDSAKIQQVPCAALTTYYNTPLCDDDVSTAYFVPIDDELKFTQVYRAYLKLNDPNRFIGSAQFLKRNINVIAEYNYQFAPKTTITLNPSQQQRTEGQAAIKAGVPP